MIILNLLILKKQKHSEPDDNSNKKVIKNLLIGNDGLLTKNNEIDKVKRLLVLLNESGALSNKEINSS